MSASQPPLVEFSASPDLKLWHLKSCPLFSKLEPDELGAIFDSTRLVALEAGERLPAAPNDEPSVWFVKRGYVKLTSVDADGRDAALMLLGPGDVFGAVNEGEELPFGESCEAMSGVCLARVTRAKFMSLLQRFPGLAYQVQKASFDRIVRLQVRLSELLMRSVEERLAITLLELDKTIGEDAPEGGRALSLNLSHRDLSQLIGSSREMVTHVMTRLRKAGLVETTARKRILLRDVAGLEKILRPG